MKAYDVQIAGLATQHAEVARLTTIPGVGTLTALTFVLTLLKATVAEGDMAEGDSLT